MLFLGLIVFRAFLSYTVDNILGLNLSNLANLRLNLASLGVRSLYWLAWRFFKGYLHGLGMAGRSTPRPIHKPAQSVTRVF